ncbi:MAG: hypothetical protein LBL41_04750 [Bifidobacteriaceae bacterium]|jgi:ribulose-phosphate 3-epimerase|nr:hypothetical protein [Bifidobacteriaceae bacterium]
MGAKISPSLMCSSMLNLPKYLDVFKSKGVDYLHIDIMDAHFAENLTFGVDQVREMRELAGGVPFDFHFMVYNPEYRLNWFDIRAGDLVSFHPQASKNVKGVIDYIRSLDAKPILALSTEQPVDVVLPYIDRVDGVMMMAVQVGFAGNKIIPNAFDKMKQLYSAISQFHDAETLENGFIVEVDGNMSPENACKMRALGANMFVAGTSAIFNGNPSDASALIDEFLEAIGNGATGNVGNGGEKVGE